MPLRSLKNKHWELREMATSPVEYTIGGVKIHFPCKAYPSQLAMMNSVSDITCQCELAASLLLYPFSHMPSDTHASINLSL